MQSIKHVGPEKKFPCYILLKTLNNSEKKYALKAAGEKTHITYSNI